MAKPIPEGYHALTPSLAVDNAAEAIEFYKRAFGAKERMRMSTPMGTIGHAELELGDSVLMLADPMPQSTVKPPKDLGGTSVGIFLYVEDVDEVVRQVVDAGGTVTIRTGTSGRSPRTRRTSRPRRSGYAARRRWPRWAEGG